MLAERAERMDKLIQLGREASKEKASERVQESQKKERQLPDISGHSFLRVGCSPAVVVVSVCNVDNSQSYPYFHTVFYA